MAGQDRMTTEEVVRNVLREGKPTWPQERPERLHQGESSRLRKSHYAGTP